jgi:hypothetical protein
MQDGNYDVLFQANVFAEWLLVRFGVSPSALLALIPLKLIAALTGLHQIGSAIVARHCEISC